VKLIFDHLVNVKDDGSFRMNMEYFDYVAGLTMTNEKFHRLFGGPPRSPESKLTQREMDLARSLQDVTDEIVMRLGRHVHRETGEKYLCLAGGVALNCVANGKLLREGPFKDIWIQPAAGDAGGSLGAALIAWHQYYDKERIADGRSDSMQGAYLGPEFSDEEIKAFLDSKGILASRLAAKDIPLKVADLLAQENVVGWFEGRMEFGPRALGARSILGDARSPKMQETMNVKIKFRESFRPFAPSVLAEEASDYFELDRPSPYMLLVANVNKKRRRNMTAAEEGLFGVEKLNVVRSDIPAVTHIDYSARIQTVHRETNPLYHELLTAFSKKYGCGVIINTSFNVRGEPIVCTPEDAYRCFMRTNMDYLLLGSYLLKKDDQEPLGHDSDWQSEFGLD
jgi:carbamoyltransferase